MKAGGSKRKGGSFERDVCERLSLWVSAGKQRDLFWRSAMSGGRSTVAAKKGVQLSRQAGDICAVAPEGHDLTNKHYIECKHLRNIGLHLFLLEDKGPLARFWRTACKQAKHHARSPMMIVKENRLPTLVIAPIGVLSDVYPHVEVQALQQEYGVCLFSNFLKKRNG